MDLLPTVPVVVTLLLMPRRTDLGRWGWPRCRRARGEERPATELAAGLQLPFFRHPSAADVPSLPDLPEEELLPPPPNGLPPEPDLPPGPLLPADPTARPLPPPNQPEELPPPAHRTVTADVAGARGRDDGICRTGFATALHRGRRQGGRCGGCPANPTVKRSIWPRAAACHPDLAERRVPAPPSGAASSRRRCAGSRAGERSLASSASSSPPPAP
jgi:hypothetical protein